MSIHRWIAFLCFATVPNLAPAKSYEQYQLDVRPMEMLPEDAQTYKRLQETYETQALSREEHRWRIEFLKKILKLKPDWLDGYWLLAGESLQLGSSYLDPEQHAIARAVLVEGRQATQTCLKQDPQQILCQFLNGSLTARIASIDGVFSSLRYAEEVHDTWQKVIRSNVNLQFRPNVSLQGVAHFGLGVFYRVVPDLAIVDWLFGVRGNIDKSIDLHRKAAEFDPQNPCNRLMLAVSLLCKVKGQAEHRLYREAMNELTLTEKIQPIDLAQAVCIRDVRKIREAPHKTCGYTQAKYQETGDPAQLKK